MLYISLLIGFISFLLFLWIVWLEFDIFIFAKSVYPYPIWKRLKCINPDQIDILFEIYLTDILKLIYSPNISVEGHLLFPRHLSNKVVNAHSFLLAQTGKLLWGSLH